MTNNGSISQSLNAGESYTIPKGYHDGTGKVTVNTLSSQTSATAGASNILSGKTAWVNGSKITGTMTNKSGKIVAATTVTESGDNTLITIPSNGYYDTSSKISVPNSELNSNLVKQGTGSAPAYTWHKIELGFKPKAVIVTNGTITSTYYINGGDYYYAAYSGTNGSNGGCKNALGSTDLYARLSLNIDDTGFSIYRNYNATFDFSYVAIK